MKRKTAKARAKRLGPFALQMTFANRKLSDTEAAARFAEARRHIQQGTKPPQTTEEF